MIVQLLTQHAGKPEVMGSNPSVSCVPSTSYIVLYNTKHNHRLERETLRQKIIRSPTILSKKGPSGRKATVIIYGLLGPYWSSIFAALAQTGPVNKNFGTIAFRYLNPRYMPISLFVLAAMSPLPLTLRRVPEI